MRRSAASYALLGVLALTSACRDSKQLLPTDPGGTRAGKSITPGTCTTLTSLTSLVTTVFGAGSPNVNSALGKLDNLDKQLQKGNITDAQAQAYNLITFIQQKAADGGLAGTALETQSLINNLLCYVGLTANVFLIYPSDLPQIILHPSGLAGVSLQGNPVGTAALLTINLLNENGPSPLITKLDKYPGYVDLTITSPLTKPAIVGVCPSATVPTDVLPHLRLGHQASTGFEITPRADASFLACSSIAQSRVPAWMKTLANLVMPKTLYAKQSDLLRGGGVGGVSTEFSPFGPVDTELLAGGVGGTSTEFLRTPIAPPTIGTAGPAPSAPTASRNLAPTARTNQLSVTCTAVEAVVGTQLAPECRPAVLITTRNGTIMQNVPVNWAVNLGGGTIAPQDFLAATCGAFAATAATATDVNGKAGVCWTLGATTGINTVIATPSAGGDAPAGVTFAPPAQSFTATATKITPTAGATGETVTYDGAAHPGSGTCSNGLTPALTYSGDGSVPTNAGSYTLTVTCGAGSPVYNTATATAAIDISQLAPSVVVTCPASVVYTGAAQTPCSATASAIGLSETLTPTYTSNIVVGTATATATRTAGGNYAAASGSATFQISAASSTVSVTCPASTVFTNSALTPCSASVSGAGGLSATLPVSYAANVDVGTATASASYAGDANHSASSGSQTFQITAAPTSTTVVCPVSVAYTGAIQNPCTASVAGPGLAQALPVSYTPSSPRVVGAYSASAAFAAGGNYQASAGSKSFSITKASATATAGSGTMTLGGTAPALPCTITGLLTGDAGAVTCTTTLPPTLVVGDNITVPLPSPTNPLNYAMQLVNGVLSVRYLQKDCFASPIYSSLPSTKSYQRKGSNLPIKCSLQTASGVPVTNASGNLLVSDLGVDGLAAPVTVLALTNAFSAGNGSYSYGLDTSPAGFVSGHYFRVIASWNDGSTTTGYFYVR